MYKILRADKDTYITNRIVDGVRAVSGNVGAAGSLDLFKLWNRTPTSAQELSRLLIHFNLDPLRTLVQNNRIDIKNPSFNCTLKLFDVYGGQPNPDHFTVVAHPLSRSFYEGLGRDVVYSADIDSANFLTASITAGNWVISGCFSGGLSTNTVDYITTIPGGVNMQSSQFFITGEEDLALDVTTAVSATLSGLIPDEGFRLALTQSLEDDLFTYFVKRFASRQAFNEDKHPRLIVRYDDSIQDDSQNLALDSSGSVFLYNYVQNRLANLTSGAAGTPITGSNSLILKLSTEISGGTYEVAFTGSQHRYGSLSAVGIYSASVFIPTTNVVINSKLTQSGSVKLTPIWGSLDGTLAYVTGSAIYVRGPIRGGTSLDPRKFVVNVHSVDTAYISDQETVLRINVFDHTSPLIKFFKVPIELPGIVIRDVHWQVRDAVTQVVEIPFDTVYNSTRASNDTSGMYFKLDMSNLTSGRSYVIDVMIVTAQARQVYRAASPVFRVNDFE